MSEDQPRVEYDALNFDGTERRANYRTIAYREDMLHVFEHKDAAAIIYQIIYRWQTEYRRVEVLKEIEKRKKAGAPALTPEEVENRMWVWMSYNDFVRESGGAVSYNTVIRMLDYLIHTVRILEQRPNHHPAFSGYEYRINRTVAKEKLKALPAEPVFAPKVPRKAGQQTKTSTHKSTAAHDSTQVGMRAQGLPKEGEYSTQKGRVSTQIGTVVYPAGETSHTYSHTPHRDSSQGDALPAQAEDALLPDSLSQETTREGERSGGMIPVVEESVARVTSEHPAARAHVIPTPAGEAGSAGPRKRASSPELSTLIDTFPHPCVKASAGQGAAGKKTGLPAPEAIALSPTARVIFDAWCALFKVEVDLTAANARAAEKLVKPVTVWCSALRVPVGGLLRDILDWLYATDTKGYYRRGVKLFDVAREFEGWQSAKEREGQTKTCVSRIPTREADPYSVAALIAEQNPGFFA